MMQKKVAQTINDLRGLINDWSAPPRILLAVSGGIDSMCMADLFSCLDESLPFALAHCNFHLRSEESDGDEAMVREWASARNVVLHVRDFDTAAYAQENGISIEMAARELRYTWFVELCRQYGYQAIAVAHNANDNAETLLLNLLRGSGLRGIGGMSLISTVPFPDNGSGNGPYLIRPLLEFTRKQIEGYVFSRKVPYREDSTNALSDYKRNRIRNEVFPILETVNPSFVRTLNREMSYFKEVGDIVEDWCSSAVPSIISCDPFSIDIPKLLSFRHWRYLLYHLLEPYGFNSAALASVEDLLSSSRTLSGKRFESDGYVLYSGRDKLTVLPKPEDVVLDGNLSQILVEGPGIYTLNGVTINVEALQRTSDMKLRQPVGVLVADADRLGFPFVFRSWRQGDWMIPFGMRGKKKVSDIFADLKYDVFQKKTAVMIEDIRTSGMADSQHVAAVAGVRIDDRYKVSDSTTGIIRITILEG